MLQDLAQALMSTLERAGSRGVQIYSGDTLVTSREIVGRQWANEETRFIPEFIVKDEGGEVIEIWFSETRNYILAE